MIALLDPVANKVIQETQLDLAAYFLHATFSKKAQRVLYIGSDETNITWQVQYDLATSSLISSSYRNIASEFGSIHSSLLNVGDQEDWAVFLNDEMYEVTLARLDWMNATVYDAIHLPKDADIVDGAGDGVSNIYLLQNSEDGPYFSSGSVLQYSTDTLKLVRNTSVNCLFARDQPGAVTLGLGVARNILWGVYAPQRLFGISLLTGYCVLYTNLSCTSSYHQNEMVVGTTVDTARGFIYAFVENALDEPNYGCVVAVNLQYPSKPMASKGTDDDFELPVVVA